MMNKVSRQQTRGIEQPVGTFYKDRYGPLPATSSPIEISIILPAFQEEQGIPPLLMQIGAVLAKMKRPYEILVVDDGSTDGTAAKAREAGTGSSHTPTTSETGRR